MKIPILYQDSHILIVNKPPGLASQPTHKQTSSNLLEILRKQIESSEIYLHHRLDKETSGVLLLSLSNKANKPLTTMFQEHRLEKTYLCLTQKGNSTLELPSEFEITNHLVKRRLNNHSVKVFRTQKSGQFSQTKFQVLKSNNNYFFLKAQPTTGRTHQIRVHCLNAGAPILGDTLYGKKDKNIPRLMLHAESISFPHPITQKQIQIQAPLPEDFKHALNMIFKT